MASRRARFEPSSHDGKALLHILDSFPRDELFQMSEDELLDISLGILGLQERQRTALFARRDPYGRFVSIFVYVPRERYNTELRQRFAALLEKAYRGTIDSFTTQLDDSVLARVHFILRSPPEAAWTPFYPCSRSKSSCSPALLCPCTFSNRAIRK